MGPLVFVAEMSQVTEQRWGLQLFTGRLFEIPISMSQLWMIMVISIAMSLLLGVVILVRRITRHVLNATFTSSAEFRQRKAATQYRLDDMLH